MKIKNKNSRPSKTKYIVVAVIALVALGGGITYAVYSANHDRDKTESSQSVNLNRSDAEKAAEETLKNDPGKKIENEQNDTPTPPTQTTTSGKQSVNVVLNYADIDKGISSSNVVAAGSVTNITEEGGKCTYTFTNGTSVVTKESTTLVNPTSTTCSSVTFPASELDKGGTWTVVLKYSSGKYEGSSNELRINK